MSTRQSPPSSSPSTFHEVVARLGPIECFDVKALQGDSIVSQSTCDFVAALALVFNDLRNLRVAVNFVDLAKSPNKTTVTRRRGETGGLEVYLVRLFASLVDELLVLLRKNATVTQGALFTEVVRSLPRNLREGWDTLVGAADGKWKATQLGRALAIVRNKVGYHYEADEIGFGFNRAFVEGAVAGTGDVPMLSRGTQLSGARFYFADAAAQAAMTTRFAGAGYADFAKQVHSLTSSLHAPLYGVVNAFLQKRGAFTRVAVDPEDSRA